MECCSVEGRCVKLPSLPPSCYGHHTAPPPCSLPPGSRRTHLMWPWPSEVVPASTSSLCVVFIFDSRRGHRCFYVITYVCPVWGVSAFSSRNRLTEIQLLFFFVCTLHQEVEPTGVFFFLIIFFKDRWLWLHLKVQCVKFGKIYWPEFNILLYDWCEMKVVCFSYPQNDTHCRVPSCNCRGCKAAWEGPSSLRAYFIFKIGGSFCPKINQMRRTNDLVRITEI